MTNISTSSQVRIPLYHDKGVEVHICVVDGRATMQITNSSRYPRVVSLANVWAYTCDRNPTIIKLGGNCIRKLPWSISDHPRFQKVDVKVSESVDETLAMVR
ncbi:MAG: hypothetical protein P1U89_01385 [Verrucomicrobiales bacterium]|nr:hypothetical protein [Verrucomicrobiales bacterium]